MPGAMRLGATGLPDPFTVDHFRGWAHELVLDNGENWVVEAFFLDFLEDYFASIPENWLIVPEGNTKTTSLAGLAVYLNEHRLSAWIPWAASSRDQAEIGYRQAEGFVFRSPRLSSFMKCQPGHRRIINTLTRGRIQIFAADDGHADGIIPTDAFLDELHRHKNLALYRTWRGKLEKRGGQIATISTAGEPGSEFEETRELIRQATPVVSRKPGFVRCRSEHISLHEWAVAEDADVEDMAVVKNANPFSAITVETLAKKRATPTMTVAHWRRFVCNLPTRGDNAAITELEWAHAATEETIPLGASIWLGVDFGWKWDTTAIVPLWMPQPDKRIFGVPKVIEPPRDGSSTSPTVVKQAFAELDRLYTVETVVMDSARAEDMMDWIGSELGVEVVDRQQSPALAEIDYEKFMEGLRTGVLKHPGDPVFTRHALSAVARIEISGKTRFAKPKVAHSRGQQHDRRVIDALVAAAMVHSAMVTQEPPPAPVRFIDLAAIGDD